MADICLEVEIKKNGEKVEKCVIPPELKDSKVAEKFVIAYFESIAKIELEKEKTEQLIEQNRRKKEEDEHKTIYVLAIVVVIAMLIISIDKDGIAQTLAAISMFIVCMILCAMRNKKNLIVSN